jgi:hypothetical protein
MSPVEFPEESNSLAPTGPLDEQLLRAIELSRALEPTAGHLSRIGALTTPEAARGAFLQWELRRRATVKFSNCERMFFSREALEQASGELAANYHASLFPTGVHVTDLTAGIGGDLIAFARRGPATGFEIDRERSLLARANLKALGLEAEVRREDGLAWLAYQSGMWVYCDPARRVEGRRVASPDQFQPNPMQVAEMGVNQNLCVIKLSPLSSDPFLESLAPRLEFLSVEGECKEALAICGSQAEPGRFAVLANPVLKLPASSLPASVDHPLEYLYEADPAAIRAHACGTLCDQLGAVPLGDSNGYLTGSDLLTSPWLKGFRVLHDGPGDVKTTRKKLVELGSATPVVKQRLTKLDLVRLRNALKMDGKRLLVVICYPLQKRVRHVIAEALS